VTGSLTKRSNGGSPMKFTDFLLGVSTDPAEMAKFRSDPIRTLENAGLSDAEKTAVLEGTPKRLKTIIQMSRRQPRFDPPTPQPTPPEPEVEPHEPRGSSCCGSKS
jgi:hypothetical protein